MSPFFAANDVVVTVPMAVWGAWLLEGDLPGEPWSGMESHFYLRGNPPQMHIGNRVYVVAHDKLRGYAPLVRVELYEHRRFALVRRGGAIATTIDESIRGFRGWRRRWWNYDLERPFPDWRLHD